MSPLFNHQKLGQSSGVNHLLQGLNLNLHRLLLIRCLAIVGQIAALCFASYFWPDSLEVNAIVTIIAIVSIICVITFIRLKSEKRVTPLEFFIQLLIDLAGLTALLYFSGGANNPFVSYYLVPLCISAAILPWRYTWLFAALAMAAYSILLFYYIPLETLSPSMDDMQDHSIHHHGAAHHQPVAGFGIESLTSKLNFHIIGMWINFIVSTGLITYFVVKMAQALKEQDGALNQQIEQRLRDEQILSIATQAAGTAHELGTPLSTLTILLEELKYNSIDNNSKQDIALMEQQVKTCREILSRLNSTAQQHSLSDLSPIRCDEFFNQVITHWQVLSPLARFQLNEEGIKPSPWIQNNPAIEQALINLLNNALRESNSPVKISTSWSKSYFNIVIEDDGAGFPNFVIKQQGKSISPSSEDGLGLGLMLTAASIEKGGGSMQLENTEVGAKVSVTLPAISTDTESIQG